MITSLCFCCLFIFLYFRGRLCAGSPDYSHLLAMVVIGIPERFHGHLLFMGLQFRRGAVIFFYDDFEKRAKSKSNMVIQSREGHRARADGQHYIYSPLTYHGIFV